MKILFYGDSITDAGRNYSASIGDSSSYGFGYVRDAVCALIKDDPQKHVVINRGISGNRIVDLYARIKTDLWNLQPDLISILIGVNDVWHEIGKQNGVELDRFINVYKMLIRDTQKALPNAKIMLIEPFVLKGTATEEKYQDFLAVKNYASAVKEIAKEFNFPLVLLQERFDCLAEKFGAPACLYDGVHPTAFGAGVIAEEWLKVFNQNFAK